jgi:hypothetical protein
MPIDSFFHPEDLMAMGLALGGLACARRDSWAWAGILLALAITSQQFAVLVLAPLVVVVPSNRRLRLIVSTVCAAAPILVLMTVATSGRIVGTLSGALATATRGDSALSRLPLSGLSLFGASRVLPVVMALALAWWCRHRIGSRVLEPVELMSLVATSISFRLVFEIQLWAYYFMAIAVSLILLDVLRGRIRVLLVLWFVALTLCLPPHRWYAEPQMKMLLHGFFPIVLFVLVIAAVGLAASPLLTVMKKDRRAMLSDPAS